MTFTEDNDPQDEHDFGSFEVEGAPEEIFSSFPTYKLPQNGRFFRKAE